MKMKVWHQISIIIALSAITCCSYTVKNSMLFSPEKQIVPNKINELKKNYQFEDVYYDVEDSIQINAWLLTKKDAKATILFLHGNAGNLSTPPWINILSALSQMNLNIFAIDYRGFGKSSGEPTLSGMYKDAQAAVNYLRSRNDIIKPIIVYGLSVGSIPAIKIAQDKNISGLIIEGAISSSDDMSKAFKSRKWYYRFWRIQLEDGLKFDSMEEIKKLDKPILIIHGRKDKSIPEYMGRKLAESALSKDKQYYVVEDGGHCNTYRIEPKQYAHKILDFIENCK